MNSLGDWLMKTLPKGYTVSVRRLEPFDGIVLSVRNEDRKWQVSIPEEEIRYCAFDRVMDAIHQGIQKVGEST